MVGTQGEGIPLVAFKGTILYDIFVKRVSGFPVQMVWAVAFTLIAWLILNRHKFGAYVYYTGDNQESARMMGIKTDMVKIIVFCAIHNIQYGVPVDNIIAAFKTAYEYGRYPVALMS